MSTDPDQVMRTYAAMCGLLFAFVGAMAVAWATVRCIRRIRR